jgi:hypothetical protein
MQQTKATAWWEDCRPEPQYQSFAELTASVWTCGVFMHLPGAQLQSFTGHTNEFDKTARRPQTCCHFRSLPRSQGTHRRDGRKANAEGVAL